MAVGTVIKLDRGFPLVRLESGEVIRCEHNAALSKKGAGATIGDVVEVDVPADHERGIILAVQPRQTVFERRDPAERTVSQALAANFATVILVEPFTDFSPTRLERVLVLAYETGAKVVVALSKADTLSSEERAEIVKQTKALAGDSVEVLEVSCANEASVDAVRSIIQPGETAILVGKSGVGKSTLVNLLAGENLQATAGVRETDGKGRHTTVDRVLIDLPGGGAIADMPGLRAFGLWNSREGLRKAFADIDELASGCKFRDCTHKEEPGCAVREAVESGLISPERLQSFQHLSAELDAVEKDQEVARRARGEKASKGKIPAWKSRT